MSNESLDEPLENEQRRRFLLAGACALGGVGVLCALTPFVSSWMPSAAALEAGKPVQVDLSGLEPGQQMTVEWQGKPVWIIRRTSDMLHALNTHINALRDPDSRVAQQPAYAQNAYRSIKPEYLVLVGVCTHLGCSPKYKPNEHAHASDGGGGFYCPCHGSRFDLSGRVFKSMPAPINLQVPPYRYLSDHSILIGEDPHA